MLTIAGGILIAVGVVLALAIVYDFVGGMAEAAYTLPPEEKVPTTPVKPSELAIKVLEVRPNPPHPPIS